MNSDVLITLIVYLCATCRFGPLVCHWTMRFEAKHKHFKQLASIIGNYINLPYTLAMRHQFFQCYLKAGKSTWPCYSRCRKRCVGKFKFVVFWVRGGRWLYYYSDIDLHCTYIVCIQGLTWHLLNCRTSPGSIRPRSTGNFTNKTFMFLY